VDWIFSALNSSTDISIIAEKFNSQIDLVFSRITFEDWVEWAYGFQSDPVQGLLNMAFNLRNDLARFVQTHATMADRLQLLQEVSFYSCTRDITNMENRHCHLDTLYHIG
jgi:sulfatase maturation enzyme AslB (radical SAM superfamily)